MKQSLLIFLLLFTSFLASNGQELRLLQHGFDTSLRGLSVVDDSVAWVSGSKGWTAQTGDRGKSWRWKQIPGYEKFDFRDIEAFSAEEAIVVSAGSPAVILLTKDGGNSWKEVYRNVHPDIFLDGMDFWSRDGGIIFGDPILSRMVLLKTTNGGENWFDISARNMISLNNGEAAFAASGTGIRAFRSGTVLIATGGVRSRLFTTKDFGESWTARDIPIIQGKNSTGPFSISFLNKRIGMAAGGDYLQDTLRTRNLVLTRNGGKTWREPAISPRGYRSAVEYISKKVLMAAGTSGVDISEDGGMNWQALTRESYHTVRRSKSGKWILLTGGEGRIAEFDPS